MQISSARKFVLNRATEHVDKFGMVITTDRIELLARMLDTASLRQNVIAQNVANVNTPGYHTLTVDFEDAYQQALASGSPAAAASVKPNVTEGAGGLERDDGNNVDVDLEMARLQKNALYFKVYSQLMANELTQFRSAITGR